MKNTNSLIRQTADGRGTQTQQRALKLLKDPSSWVGRIVESPTTRRLRAELQQQLIERGVEVQKTAAEQDAMNCKLQMKFEFQQVRDRELIEHRNAVTRIQIDAQNAAVHQITDMMEEKEGVLSQLDAMPLDPQLRQLAEHTISETFNVAAQDLVDHHDE